MQLVREREHAAARHWKSQRKLTCKGFVNPERDALGNFGTDPFAGDGSGEELPVAFGVKMSAVQRQAVLLEDGVVPVTLDFVDVLWDEGKIAIGLQVDRLQRCLFLMKGCRCSRGERGGGKVEA